MMWNMSDLRLLALLATLGATACGGDDDRPGSLPTGDGEEDASVADAGADAGNDAGTDAGMDAGTDAGTDAGSADAAPDAGDAGRTCLVNSDCDDLDPCNDDRCAAGACEYLVLGIVDRDGDGEEDFRCGGLDCDDTDPDVPVAVEACNHKDDDCDGAVDEGALRKDAFRLVEPGRTRYVSIAEGFGGFGALWADDADDMHFARLSGAGAVIDGPYDLAVTAVSDTPGDSALVETPDGFLAAWCQEDGDADHLNIVRIPDGAAPELPAEVDLPGSDLCFNPSMAFSGEFVAVAWMGFGGGDYTPAVAILEADGSEAVAPAIFDQPANDRSIDVAWFGDTFAVFFRGDVGGALADGGKLFSLSEAGEMGVVREFDDDGEAILADAAAFLRDDGDDLWEGSLVWTIDTVGGLYVREMDSLASFTGVEDDFEAGATYPSVASGPPGTLAAWVTTELEAGPLGASSVTAIQVVGAGISTGAPSVAADDTGFGVLYPVPNDFVVSDDPYSAGLYFTRIDCP